MLKLFISICFVISLNSSENLLVNAPTNYKMNFTKDTRCLVRNLKVYKNPKWVSKIELKNGKEIFFSSPKSMFEFYHRPGKWYDVGVKSEKDFKNIIVTDFLTMKLINAKTAYYIYGSRATSPAGDDMVVIETKQNAEAFAKQYSGKRVFSFTEVSDPLIRLINERI